MSLVIVKPAVLQVYIYIPLGNKYTYEQSKEFARIIVTLVNREIPSASGTCGFVNERKNVPGFLEPPSGYHSRSVFAASKACATVSMPLHWKKERD
ncbi:hypothetical protein CS542_01235 [Pedobacter sp. IW39]|nr:hypothetical protein CS542_01235 [Pedobacter sp. IW39]